jgi:hypothetical protein
MPKLTAAIIDEHVIAANEFRQHIDLFIWKPPTLIQDAQIQQIIKWRDTMFHQRVPSSEIIATRKCIGFPAEDGECFYWANPGVSPALLESMAKEHEVKLAFYKWNATCTKEGKENIQD